MSRKYDGTFRFSTDAELLHASHTALLGRGEPGRTVRRAEREVVRRDWSLEYLPLRAPYNIVSFFGLDGSPLYHFCNVLLPPILESDTLSYVDLDLDVVVWPGGAYEVQDRDQFERNAVEMAYPPEVVELAWRSLGELEALASAGGHLFGCRERGEAERKLLELYAGDG